MKLAVFAAVFAVAIGFSWGVGQAGEVVRIEGIDVAARDDSAVAARRLAFRDARAVAIERAFGVLGLSRRSLSRAEREAAIGYMEIRQEKVGPETYAANFAIGVVASVLRGSGMTPKAPPATVDLPDWFLVIPVHRRAGEVRVWDASAPWSRVWGQLTTHDRPWVVATADDVDRELLSIRALEERGAGLLRDIGAKYRAPAVVLAVLDHRDDGSARVRGIAWRQGRGRADVSFDLDGGRGAGSALYRAARDAVQDGLIRAWHSRGPGVRIRAEFPADAAAAERRRQLEAVPGLRVMDHGWRSGRSIVELEYAGSKEALLTVLRERGFLTD